MNKFNVKAILFASLIAVMVLPFVSMDSANATTGTTEKPQPDQIQDVQVDWNKAKKSSGVELEATTQGSTSIVTSTCPHYASMSDKCEGWDNGNGDFFYRTPNTHLTPDFCEEYTCADTDHFQWAPSQVSEGGYAYAFKSATFRACAHDAGVCTSPTVWTEPFSTWVGHNNVPTDDQITAYTTYVYERSGGDKVTKVFVVYLTQGYS